MIHLTTSLVGILFFSCILHYVFFFFTDPATTEIYTLSLHDALPISRAVADRERRWRENHVEACAATASRRSEEHTSELQSRLHLVCRLLLEKKKTQHFHSHGGRRPRASARCLSRARLRCHCHPALRQ